MAYCYKTFRLTSSTKEDTKIGKSEFLNKIAKETANMSSKMTSYSEGNPLGLSNKDIEDVLDRIRSLATLYANVVRE